MHTQSMLQFTDIDKSISQEILTEFVSLVEKHNIKWVSGKNSKGVFFPLHLLSAAKNKNSKDFSKNYKPTLTMTALSGSGNTTSVWTSHALAGTFLQLRGDALSSFKEEYVKQYGAPYPKASVLWVADFTGALSYLMQGSTQVNSKNPSNISKDFQAHASNALEKNYNKAIEDSAPASKEFIDAELLGENSKQKVTRKLTTNNNKTSLKFATEDEVEDSILRLADYSGIKFIRQFVLVNELRNSSEWNNTFSRRLDLLRIEPKEIIIYEIKLKSISAEHISQTIASKGYITLVKKLFPNKKIKLVFITPEEKVLTDCAERLVSIMSKKALRDIRFQYIGDLAQEIVDATLTSIPPSLRNQFYKHRLVECTLAPLIAETTKYSLSA